MINMKLADSVSWRDLFIRAALVVGAVALIVWAMPRDNVSTFKIEIGKPWHYSDCKMGDSFWHYANETEFYGELFSIQRKFSDEDRERDIYYGEHLEELILEKFGHRPSEPVVLTVPSEDGAYCGCSVVRCEVCREVIEVTWIPAGDGAGPDKATSSLREALSGIKDAPPTESADYFADGTLDIKDVAALGRIMNTEGR